MRIMIQLRKRFSTLWTSNSERNLEVNGAGSATEEEEKEGNSPRESPEESHDTRLNGYLTSPSDSNSNNYNENKNDALINSTRNIVRLRIREETKQDHHQECGGEEAPLAPQRVLNLAQPWGSTDANPPKDWSSQHHSTAATTFRSSRGRRGRGRRPGMEQEGDFSGGAIVFCDAAGSSNSGSVAPVHPKTTAAADASTTALTALTSPSSVRLGERRADGQQWQQRSSTKRKQSAAPGKKAGRGEGKGDDFTATGTATAVMNYQLVEFKPTRRRRTCPADSTFVSPMKRSTPSRSTMAIVHTSTTAITSLPQQQLSQEEDEDASALHARLFPPSHLIFRSGFLKAIASRRRRGRRSSGGRGDGSSDKSKKGRSSNRLKRRGKELHALIASRALNAAYSLQHPTGGEVKDGDDSATVEAAAAVVPRNAIEEDPVWERVKRQELEEEEEAEKRVQARLGRLRAL